MSWSLLLRLRGLLSLCGLWPLQLGLLFYIILLIKTAGTEVKLDLVCLNSIYKGYTYEGKIGEILSRQNFYKTVNKPKSTRSQKCSDKAFLLDSCRLIGLVTVL